MSKKAAIDWLLQASASDRAELEIWRACYPHRARYIREEAAAKVDGREPNYPAPIAIG